MKNASDADLDELLRHSEELTREITELSDKLDRTMEEQMTTDDHTVKPLFSKSTGDCR